MRARHSDQYDVQRPPVRLLDDPTVYPPAFGYGLRLRDLEKMMVERGTSEDRLRDRSRRALRSIRMLQCQYLNSRIEQDH